jgi:hypothetical protein
LDSTAQSHREIPAGMRGEELGEKYCVDAFRGDEFLRRILGQIPHVLLSSISISMILHRCRRGLTVQHQDLCFLQGGRRSGRFRAFDSGGHCKDFVMCLLRSE